MKKQVKLVSLLCFIYSASTMLCAQTKERTLSFTKNTAFHKVLTSGDNTFIIINGEGLEPTSYFYHKLLKIKKVTNSVMKYNQDLEPIWKAPVVLSSSDYYVFNSFPYTDATTKTTLDYLIGTEQFVQIRPDGSVKEQKTGIPTKEVKNTAAVFTDTHGLNILTLTGDKAFPTETMNWYTFSHDNLSLTKRTITLPLPPNTDGNNKSVWRLNDVTASGLYFYHVSFRRDVTDHTRPILSTHVVGVDSTGKAGAIVTIPSDVKKYNILAVNYQQDIYPQLTVMKPELYERGMNSGSKISNDPFSDKNTYYSIASDNARMGVKIDATAKRIYTVVTMHSDSAERKASGMTFVSNINMSIAYLRFSTYDLAGQKLAESHLKLTLPRLRSDLPADIFQKIDISPMSYTEGVVCKFMSLDNGFLWAFDNKGALSAEHRIKPYFYKGRFNTYHYEDIFAAHYASLRDMKDSPYLLKEKSPAYQCFQKLKDKEKQTVDYYALKDYELMSVWDSKTEKFKLYTFNKK